MGKVFIAKVNVYVCVCVCVCVCAYMGGAFMAK